LQPLTETRDYWGNCTMTFKILPPHRRVVVTGRSVVETHRKPFEPQALSDFETERAHFDYMQFGGPVEYSNEAKTLGENAGLIQRSARRRGLRTRVYLTRYKT
jgi:hypothetical protein